jgi:hypothetical protein
MSTTNNTSSPSNDLCCPDHFCPLDVRISSETSAKRPNTEYYNCSAKKDDGSFCGWKSWTDDTERVKNLKITFKARLRAAKAKENKPPKETKRKWTDVSNEVMDFLCDAKKAKLMVEYFSETNAKSNATDSHEEADFEKEELIDEEVLAQVQNIPDHQSDEEEESIAVAKAPQKRPSKKSSKKSSKGSK